MSVWNQNSQRNLGGVNDHLQRLMAETRIRTGVPFEVAEGLRSPERQRQMVAEGKSKTLNSRHLDGRAMDVYIPDGRGGMLHDYRDYQGIADEAKAIAERKAPFVPEANYDSFKWGGDWQSLRDGVHFELAGRPGGGTFRGTPGPRVQAGLASGPPGRSAAGLVGQPAQQSVGSAGPAPPPVTEEESPFAADGLLAALFGKRDKGRGAYQAGLNAGEKGGLFSRGKDGSLNVFGRTLNQDQRMDFARAMLGLGRMMG